MSSIRKILTSAVLVALAIPDARATAQSLSASIKKLESSDYTVRSAAFYRILRIAGAGAPFRSNPKRLASYAHKHPQLATALIALLERENAFVSKLAVVTEGKDKMEGGDDPYYTDLIESVEELRDVRAVNALLGIYGGDSPSNGLGMLGQAAVPGLLAKLRSSGNHSTRVISADILGMMVNARMRGLDTAAIKSGLLQKLTDPDWLVRVNIIEALCGFSGQDVRGPIAAVAVSDTLPKVREAAVLFCHEADSVRAAKHVPVR